MDATLFNTDPGAPVSSIPMDKATEERWAKAWGDIIPDAGPPEPKAEPAEPKAEEPKPEPAAEPPVQSPLPHKETGDPQYALH